MILSDAVLHKLDRLSLLMRAVARGGAGGARRSKALGASAEFSDFREYAAGDDIRRIDWNAYARFDKLFLKLFMEEQESCLTVFLDASASMACDGGGEDGEDGGSGGFGGSAASGASGTRGGSLGGNSSRGGASGNGGASASVPAASGIAAPLDTSAKWRFALTLCETLIYLALRGGDHVRVVPLGGALPPDADPRAAFAGRGAFPQACALLEGIRPVGTADADALIPRVELGGRRGLCALVSDLLTGGVCARALDSLLFRQQEVLLLHVLSEEEWSPSFEGALKLTDIETGAEADLIAAPDTLAAYDRALRDFLREAETFCHRRAIPYRAFHAGSGSETEVAEALFRMGAVG